MIGNYLSQANNLIIKQILYENTENTIVSIFFFWYFEFRNTKRKKKKHSRIYYKNDITIRKWTITIDSVIGCRILDLYILYINLNFCKHFLLRYFLTQHIVIVLFDL